MPVDYSKGKIYQIIDYTNDNVYVGSTCEPTLARRLAGHVSNYKAYLNGKRHFTTSCKIIENNNFDIQLIEAFPCTSKDELHKREGYHIKNTPNCINKRIEGRTRTQYKQDNKERISEYKKEHYTNNKEKIIQLVKRNYEDNKERILDYKKQKTICICGSEFRKSDKSKHERSQKHKSFIENQQVTVN